MCEVIKHALSWCTERDINFEISSPESLHLINSRYIVTETAKLRYILMKY